MDTVYIRGIELPPRVKGVTVVDCDGNYNIYVNTLLCEEAQQEVLEHEMCHVVSGHFEGYAPVIENEFEARSHFNIDRIQERLREMMCE